jgi:hypothetical protein
MQLPHARVAVYVALAREDAFVAEAARAQHLAVPPAKQCQGFAIVGVENLEGHWLGAAEDSAARRSGVLQ